MTSQPTTSPAASKPRPSTAPRNPGFYRWVAINVVPKVTTQALARVVDECEREVVAMDNGPPRIGLHRELAERCAVPIKVAHLFLGAALYRRIRIRWSKGVHPIQVIIAREVLETRNLRVPSTWVKPLPKPYRWAPRAMTRTTGVWSRFEWRPRQGPGGKEIEGRARGPWQRDSQPECGCGDAFDMDEMKKMPPPKPPRIQCSECKAEVQVRPRTDREEE